MSVTCRAKINLCLHVVGKRPDGFHQLQSLVTFAQFGDELSIVDQTHTGGGDELQIDGEFASLLANDKTNLVIGALDAFRKRWPKALTDNLALRLTKNLPIASGIGGGSANAASLLKLASEISSKKIDPEQLQNLAANIGSDVPVCLLERPAIMAGRGEDIKPLKNFPTLFAVLVNPGITVSTREIFANLDQVKNGPLPDISEKFSMEELVNWLHRSRNDLDQAAKKKVPEIARIIAEFQANPNCLFARMSGSGATVFALFNHMEKAEQGAEIINKKWPEYWVKPTILMGSG
ncbi:4-diphosphocytidyl-2-C-methyl-D-erythritol kinase [hydrothermal vent metagenome]|uniref:4-(cytidine 5'-diphospho)-2-C-methyl-D-erythritol kinase n=1 Tax=hydrothermal vent metagenome TaxID=652676 RepID=A0A3B0TQ95_9ZZZZ